MSMFIKKSVRAMQAYVPGEQSRESGIVKLNTNENPYPASPLVAKALRSIAVKELRLYPEPTASTLRRRIARIHACEVDNVFVGNGSDEILSLCTRAFVEDNGSIGFFNPSYSLYPVLAAARNVSTQPVELSGDFGWHMPGRFHTSLFFLTHPNAPTGMLYGKSVVKRFCKGMKGVVVIDEAYVDFSKEHCMSLALELKNVIVVRTLSKAYSLAGLRVGYAAGPRALIAALFKLKDSYNVDTIAQHLALAALSDLAHMRGNVGRIRRTRARLARLLTERGAFVYASETNFLWVKPPVLPAKAFYERLREKQILVRYFEGNRTSDFVRITIGTDAQADRLVSAMDDMGLGVTTAPRPIRRATNRKG